MKTMHLTWSAAAVVMAVVLSLGLMARPAQAAVTATTLGSATVNLTTNATNGTGAYTSLANIVLTAGAAADFTTAGFQLAPPTGWQFGGTVPTVTVGTGAAVAQVQTATFTAGTLVANESLTIGAVVYTFTQVPTGTATSTACQVKLENAATVTLTWQTTMANLVATINSGSNAAINNGCAASTVATAANATATTFTITSRTAGTAVTTATGDTDTAWAITTANAATTFLPGTPTIASDGSTATITITTANGAASTLTIAGLQIRPITNSSATGNVTNVGAVGGLAAGTNVATVTAGTALVAPYAINLAMVAVSTNCLRGAALVAVTPSLPADGSQSNLLCAAMTDANSNPVTNTPITFTVSNGIVSTGTAKTVAVFTSASSTANTAGTASTAYRGAGGAQTTDTAVATAPSATSAVGTLSIALTVPSGNTASKLAFGSFTQNAIASTVTNVSPGYVSPDFGTSGSVQVQDGSGLGVNSQSVQLTVDRGAIVTGTNAACAGVTQKSIILTSSSQAPVANGTAQAGTVVFTVCGNQLDAPGKLTVTASNVTTTMANATGTISLAGRPAKIAGTATGNTIVATVTDAGGNNVADGTVVRFTMSTNASATSTACTTTTNGTATTVVALIAATGSVIASTDWNESGAIAPGCSASAAGNTVPQVTVSTGNQSLAVSVTVPGGTSSTGTTPPATTGTGSVSSGSIPAAGGFGLIVASGNITAVVTASGCPAASMALWATVNGNFVTYVPGTTITAVNADFLAALPGGNLPAGTPLIGKCK